MNELDFLMRIGVALAGGLLIGFERQWRQRMAGLRTNTLVSTGAALFVFVSLTAENEVSPTRIAAQIVSGIGFIGGGVIIREGINVRGLNTAATLWCSAAVGTLAGVGQFTLAGAGAVVVLLANLLLRPLQMLINRQPADQAEMETHYRIHVGCRQSDEIALRQLLLDGIEQEKISLRSLSSRDSETPGQLDIQADIFTPGRQDVSLEHIVSRLSREEGVSAVSWRIEV